MKEPDTALSPFIEELNQIIMHSYKELNKVSEGSKATPLRYVPRSSLYVISLIDISCSAWLIVLSGPGP